MVACTASGGRALISWYTYIILSSSTLHTTGLHLLLFKSQFVLLDPVQGVASTIPFMWGLSGMLYVHHIRISNAWGRFFRYNRRWVSINRCWDWNLLLILSGRYRCCFILLMADRNIEWVINCRGRLWRWFSWASFFFFLYRFWLLHSILTFFLN